MASNGEESEFFYGIKNNASIVNASPTLIVSKNADGTYEHTLPGSIPLTNSQINTGLGFTAANDAQVVKVTTNQIIAGVKTFSSDIIVANSLTAGRGGGNLSTNTAFGNLALYSNTGGTTNTAVGASALLNNISGSNNTAIGRSALINNRATNNTAIGVASLSSNTTGFNNIAIGSDSGSFIADKITVATVITNSVMLGFNTSPLADNQTNQIVIGYNSIGLGSNTSVLGNLTTIFARIWGRVLIGGSGDDNTNALQVTGSAKITSLAGTGTRNVLADSTGKLITAAGYKVYTVVLSQSGLNAPTATILENTLSGVPAFGYVSAGQYTLTLANEFTTNKVFISATVGTAVGTADLTIRSSSNSTSEILIQSTSNAAFANDLINNSSLEIRVYS